MQAGKLIVMGSCLLMMPKATLADYAVGLSPLGSVDSLDPIVQLTAYPADTLEAATEVELGFNLADQISVTLSVEIFRRDSQGGETLLMSSDLTLGQHTQALDLTPGVCSLVLRARDEFGNLGEVVGDVLFVQETAVEGAFQPLAFSMDEAAPNPFNPTTTLSFTIPAAGSVTLVVVNLRGEVVHTLVDGRLPSGRHRAVFQGAHLPSGLYLACLEWDDRQSTTRFTLLK